eukprot:scaffold202079_cov37-Tisochrysis_lutea.AAC.1
MPLSVRHAASQQAPRIQSERPRKRLTMGTTRVRAEHRARVSRPQPRVGHSPRVVCTQPCTRATQTPCAVHAGGGMSFAISETTIARVENIGEQERVEKSGARNR